MRIAANLGVCDEVELIAPCIRHLRSIGVDFIFVTDVGSSDGTAEILREFAKDSDISLTQLSREDDPWGFPERMYQKTIANGTFDRVLFLDPDEFWLPMSGSLKNTSALDADVVSVPSFNVPLVEGRELLPGSISPRDYSDIHFVVQPVENAQASITADPNLPYSMVRVPPKIIVNPDKVMGAAMGCHGAVGKPGMRAVTKVAGDMVIAHLPFSTSARFHRKVDNIRRSFAHFGHRLVGRQAWHWRRWLELADQGKGEEEFRRQILTRQRFDGLISAGVVQSVQQWLEFASAELSVKSR